MGNDEYLTPHELARLLKISYNGALDFIKRSGVPYLKIGKQYRVDRCQLRQYLSERIEENGRDED